MNKVLNKFFKDNKQDKIFTYEEFMEYSENKLNETDIENLDEKGKIYYDYSKINLHRVNRINKTFKANEEIVKLVQEIDKEQTWLIITEDWCGDSAQNLPYLNKYLSNNPLIKIIIILRDSNLEAIDNYFTNGNPRSIPKIVVFDNEANELFAWGPRPKFAQDLVQQLKSEGYTNKEFNKELHLWYARNRGKEFEMELLGLLKKIK